MLQSIDEGKANYFSKHDFESVDENIMLNVKGDTMQNTPD